MVGLLDIGNTHTHLGVGTETEVLAQARFHTRDLVAGGLSERAATFLEPFSLEGAVFCSVVPELEPQVRRMFEEGLGVPVLELRWDTLWGVGIDYPAPETIGADRLANAVAARHHFGSPVVVVDFGTAVTFDVVDRPGNYIGGIIAPGLSAMTEYLHEKTALLPRIEIREPGRVVGRNTEEAMLSGAVYGYRGMIRGLLAQLKAEMGTDPLKVVATGGSASLIAEAIPEIVAVRPGLTLEGLRLVWLGRERGLPLSGEAGA